MQSENFSFVQSKEEIKFILKKKNNIIFIPLNLDSLIYLEINKINFLNPKEILNNDDHKKFISFTEKFISGINCGNIKFESLKIEFKSQIRFIINSCIYLIEILKKIEKKKKIFLVLSGWNGKNITKYGSDEKFLASKIISNCFQKKKLIFLSEDYKKKFQEIPLNKFTAIDSIISKNDILINNLGYNFYRILLFKNFFQKVYTINFGKTKLNWFKRLIFWICGYREIKFLKIKTNKKINFKILKIKLLYKKLDISKYINIRKEELECEMSDIYYKLEAIKKIPNFKNFKYYFSFHNRGLDGSICELLKDTGCNTINISHGTVSESYNKYDRLYKKIIAESVFSGKFKFFAIQSKIIEKSLINTNNKIKKIIKTNNLIFSNVTSKLNNKNYSLYAVTLKKFHGLQFFGVEMYYEFFENLKLLNKIARKDKSKKIIVNLHLSHKNLVQDIQSLFLNLIITSEKIDKLIDKSFVVISYSSTSIEDAIASNRFVVLLDQWKRYRHYRGTIYKNFNTIYYVNTESELNTTLKNLSKRKKEFNKYKNQNNLKENFKQIFYNK